MSESEQVKCDFLRKRMIDLREANSKSQSEMADIIYCNKSTLSRAEKIGGDTGYKTVRSFAERYWKALYDPEGILERSGPLDGDFQLKKKNLEEQLQIFLRGENAAVVDTSALLKNPQLVDELIQEYSHVVIPETVVNELDAIKDHNNNGLAPKAWQILKSIGTSNDEVLAIRVAKGSDGNNDCKIIRVAEQAAEEFNCKVDLITYDAGFAARLNGHATVRALFLEEYMLTKQNLIDIDSLRKLNNYYANSYDNVEQVLKIRIPNKDDINAYLPDGNTLIISAVRSKKPLNQRKEKIRWLIAHGADVNRRDCGKYYFPPLSHSIQKDDFEIFKFLLHDCNANPNVGSRNPHDAGKIRQKNDGNMPLMIAAWDNRVIYVKELIADERTSLNQQDGNGFTALIKACYWGYTECSDLLTAAGADIKIVDRDGYTAADRYHEYLETGRHKNHTSQKGDNKTKSNKANAKNKKGKRQKQNG